MKKRERRLMMTLLCAFALGAWLSPLHADTGPQKRAARAGGGIVWTPMIQDAAQLNANSIQPDAPSDFINLIDNNVSTIFHSVWHTDMALITTTEESWTHLIDSVYSGVNTDPGYHFLQVDLGRPVSMFRFEYKGREDEWHDNPNRIEIFATNDASLFNSPVNSNQGQWTRIEELTPENTDFPADVFVTAEPWKSPVIDMAGKDGGPFQYLRFVVKSTTHMNTVDTRRFLVPDITGVTYNLSEFQVYAGIEAESAKAELEALTDSVAKLWGEYEIGYGDSPGYADSAMYAEAYKLYDECYNALYEELDDSQYADYVTRLRTAVSEFMAEGIHPVVTGYYNLVSGYSEFEKLQFETKSMSVDVDKNLVWTTSDSLDAKQLWRVEKLPGGNWSIQNAASGQYIGSVPNRSTPLPMTDTHQCDQVFELIRKNPGQFKIHNVDNTVSYHVRDADSGRGTHGTIENWNGGDGNSGASWYVRPVTDGELLERLLDGGPQSMLAAAMKLALDSAEASRGKANDYAKLITSAGQISSNAQSPGGDGSAYANLIDGDYNSIFHSVWEEGFSSPQPAGSSYGWHNLQIALDEPVSRIFFEFTGRNNSEGWTDTPDHITLYGTSDEALGASTAAADSSSWTLIEDMAKPEYMFPYNMPMAHYLSPVIEFGGQAYKYLRFAVKHTTTMYEGNNRANSFASPDATGVTFNLSEFQVYNAEPSANSEYNTVEGMKEACDALDGLIEESRRKLAGGTLTQADIDALQRAYRLVDTLYVDRGALYGEMQSLLESGRNLYNNAIGERVPLIKDASQLSTNSSINGADAVGGTLSVLIDGSKADNSTFHSVWHKNSMIDPNITVEQWEDTIKEKFPNALGAGYHNLNVDLREPVSSFFFEYYTRNNNDGYTDNPSDIEIYATNDAELYGDVRDAYTDQWTLIGELTEGFPTGKALDVPYTSPEISLADKGGPYRYVRFRIKNTCTANQPNSTLDRKFANPDVTGITWNVSEFQMYSGLDPGSVQYNYSEEVRAAADTLKALLDKYGGYKENDINSGGPVSELAEAIRRLRDSYADTAEVARLYSAYKGMLSRADEGDKIGEVDNYSEIEEFGRLLDEARGGIDPKKPTKEAVSAALQKINDGYDAFMEHVRLPEPYVWYVIRSGVTSESYAYAVGQPIFLDNISTGAQLKIGTYPIGDNAEFSDVYAVWRLVPAGPEDETAKPWERKYAVQSLGTGQYWGPYRGDGSGSSPLMSHGLTPYNFYFYGMGCFRLQQDGVADPEDCLKADGTDFVVLNWPSNGGDQQAWKFEPAAEQNGGMININWFPAKSTGVLTLPWDMTGENAIKALNPEVETYVVSGVDTAASEAGTAEYSLSLAKEEEFEAGEPFVIFTTAEPDANGQQPLYFNLPPEGEPDAITDTSLIVNNGLVGTLEGFNIRGMVNLYFENSTLYVSTNDTHFIPGRSGYIDVRNVRDLGPTDAVVRMYGTINRIEEAAAEGAGSDAAVDVYTVDGVLLKRGVRASEAAEGLGRGVYIIGRKKVLVR